MAERAGSVLQLNESLDVSPYVVFCDAITNGVIPFATDYKYL